MTPASRFSFATIALALVLAGCSSSTSTPGGGGSCALPAAASLSVLEVTPHDRATGVFVGASISVRFNTCLDESTISSANFHLASLGFIAGSLLYDPATATVTFRPSANLAYGTSYIIGVTSVKGAHGETMAAPFGSSFTTQASPETVPPTTAATPTGGYYNSTQSVALTCTDNVGGTGCAATYYTVDGTTPTVRSTRYAGPVAIGSSATLRFFSVDVQGNAEAPKQEVYVIDKVPPNLTASDPGDGTIEVPVTKVVTATFSEAMKASSFGPGSVSVDNGVTVSLSYAEATNTLSITPTERLTCNTTYHVAIGAGATDLAGNGLVQPATLAFKTTTDCLEPATTASVVGGVYRAAQSVTLTCSDVGGSGCARIVYTIDGTLPSLAPTTNGIIVTGATAGPIAIGVGDTVLRYFSEDAAGNREVLREQTYSVSTTGFTFVGTNDGLARGVGPVPASFVSVRPGGRTYVFHRDPSNNRLYRGTERGLLFSDGGEAWTFLPASIPSVISVLAQGSKVFAGSSAGLLVSTDGGGTFATRNLGVSGAGYVKSVLASGNAVFAATDSGVAVSADKGQTFTMRTTADGVGSNSVRALVLAGSTLYAATGGGVSVSTDGGATFTNYAVGLASPSVNAIAVSGSTVYAGTDGGLCVSTDGGHSYTVQATTATGLGSNYVREIVLAGSTLYLATDDPWSTGTTRPFAISTNGGSTFTFPLVCPKTDPGLKINSIFVEGSTVRIGAYPTYYLSTNGGSTFVSEELRGALLRVTGSGANLYAAVQDSSGHGGVAVSTDGGQSFVVRGMEDGLAINSVDDVFAAGSNVYAATFWGVGFSTDGGATFVNHNTSTAANSGCVYASGTTVWAGAGGALEKSTGGGAFSAVQSGTGGGLGIAVSGANFYLATTGGLWVSNASGANGSFILKGAAQGLANTGLSGVAVDSGGTVLAVSSSSGGPNGFYVSRDNGASFTSLGTTMFPVGIYAYGTTWYASTYSPGLGISTDGGATWIWRSAAQGVQATPRAAWYMP
jgi:Bacterial Ig-like domain/Chitobiase/beta-hexosaminidase C-terminal domain